MKVELLPFTTPNYVIQKMPAGNRQDGYRESPKYHLRDVPAEDLAALCDQFHAEIFAKADKADPVERMR